MRTNTRRRTRWHWFAALMATTALLVAGCASAGGGSSSTTGSDKPLRILALGPLTGPVSNIGKGYTVGLTAAVNKVNAAGGILGRQVDLEFVDTQADGTKAVSALQTELASNPPDLVWAGFSSEALAIGPILTARKIISFNNSSTESVRDPEQFPFAFSLTGNRPGDAANVLRWAQNGGYKKVSILASDDAIGHPASEAYDKALKDAGVTSDVTFYKPGVLDMTPELTKINNEKPDALVFVAVSGASGYILDGRHKLGMTLPSLADISASSSPLSNVATPEKLDNVFQAILARAAMSSSPPAPVKDFITETAKVGTIDTAANFVMYPWDAVLAYKTAAEAAKSTDPTAVKAKLEDLAGVSDTFASYAHLNWSATYHGVTLAPTDETVIPPSPIQNGFFAVPGA